MAAINAGLQISTDLVAAGVGNIIGVQVVCTLTGANETPALADLTLPAGSISLRRKPSSSQSDIALSLSGNDDDLAAIIERPNGELIMSLYARLEDASTWLIADYTFNYAGFDYAGGPNSATIELKGGKYINAIGAGNQRLLTRWAKKSKRLLGAAVKIDYTVPILNVLTLLPGDALTDGTDAGIITSINYMLSKNLATAALEVY